MAFYYIFKRKPNKNTYYRIILCGNPKTQEKDGWVLACNTPFISKVDAIEKYLKMDEGKSL